MLGRLLCRLVGHQPPVYKRPERYQLHEYLRQVRVGPDTEGREQIRLYSVCPRCGTEFRVGRAVLLPSIEDELLARGHREGRRAADEEANERVLEAQLEADRWKAAARDVGEELDGTRVALAKLYTGTGPGDELWCRWDDRYVRVALGATGTADHLAEAFKRVARGPYRYPEDAAGRVINELSDAEARADVARQGDDGGEDDEG